MNDIKSRIKNKIGPRMMMSDVRLEIRFDLLVSLQNKVRVRSSLLLAFGFASMKRNEMKVS